MHFLFTLTHNYCQGRYTVHIVHVDVQLQSWKSPKMNCGPAVIWAHVSKVPRGISDPSTAWRSLPACLHGIVHEDHIHASTRDLHEACRASSHTQVYICHDKTVHFTSLCTTVNWWHRDSEGITGYLFVLLHHREHVVTKTIPSANLTGWMKGMIINQCH